MTGRTTAHLTTYDDRYLEIEKLHGEEGARLTAESHTAAIEKISQIIAAENIDCDFEWLDGFLFCGAGTLGGSARPNRRGLPVSWLTVQCEQSSLSGAS